MTNLDFQNGYMVGIAASGTAKSSGVQADWNQNDPNKASYIKNRTHWKEEFERDYKELPNVEPDPTIGLIVYGKKLGLEIGKEYTVDMYDISGGITTVQTVVAEGPAEDIGLNGVPIMLIEHNEVSVIVYDGIYFDIIEGKPILADNCIYDIDSTNIEKVVIHGIPNIETVVHKIPNEFIDFPEIPKVIIDQEYNAESENAQSGIAIKQAINEYDNQLRISTDKLVNNSVTTDKLANGSVDVYKIANDSIMSKHLRKGSVEPINLSGKIPYSKLLEPKLYKTITVSEDVNILEEMNTNSIYKMLVKGKIFTTDTENTTQKLFILPNSIIAGYMHGKPIISIDIPFILDNVSKGIEFYAVIESLYTCDICDLTVWASGDSSKRVYARSAIQEKSIPRVRGIDGFSLWLNYYKTPNIGAGSYIEIYTLEG